MSVWRWFVLTGLVTGCGGSTSAPNNITTLSLEPAPEAMAAAGGDSFTLTAEAMLDGSARAAAGQIVTFSTNVTGLAFTPPAVAVDDEGHASATVIVPYGTTAVAEATMPNGGADLQSMSADAAMVKAQAPVVLASSAGGQVIALTAHATDPHGKPAMGVALGFTTNAMGVTFAPATVVTDGDGAATSSALIPFGMTPVIGFVSGGGGADAISLSPDSGITLTAPKPVATDGLPELGGTLVTVSASAAVGTVELVGLPVTFATDMSTPVFVPASVATDPSGVASSQVFVPYGTSVVAIVAAAGSSQVVDLSAALPKLSFVAPGPATVTPGTSGSASAGKNYELSVQVKDSTRPASPPQGVAVTFAATGAASFVPASALTDATGFASSVVYVPDEAGDAGAVQVAITSPGIMPVILSVPQ